MSQVSLLPMRLWWTLKNWSWFEQGACVYNLYRTHDCDCCLNPRTCNNSVSWNFSVSASNPGHAARTVAKRRPDHLVGRSTLRRRTVRRRHRRSRHLVWDDSDKKWTTLINQFTKITILFFVRWKVIFFFPILWNSIRLLLQPMTRSCFARFSSSSSSLASFDLEKERKELLDLKVLAKKRKNLFFLFREESDFHLQTRDPLRSSLIQRWMVRSHKWRRNTDDGEESGREREREKKKREEGEQSNTEKIMSNLVASEKGSVKISSCS